MSEDVWEAGDQAGLPRDDLGEPDYENGLPGSAVFTLSTVFGKGLALVREQPLLLLLAGFNIWLVQLLPSLISTPVSVALAIAAESGDVPPEMVQVASNVVSFGTALMVWPIQMILAAGAMVAVARFVRSEDVSIAALYTSVREAVSALLASLAVGLIMVGVMVVALAPLALLALIGNAELAIVVGLLWFVLLLLPLFYIGLGLQLAPYAAVLDGAGPVEAVRASWAAADGARVSLFVLFLVFAVLNFIGMCLCLLPAIPVVAIQTGGLTVAWLLHARAEEEVDKYPFIDRNGAF